MPFLPPNQQRQSTEGIYPSHVVVTRSSAHCLCVQCWCTSAQQWRLAAAGVDLLRQRSTVAGVRLHGLVPCSPSVSLTLKALAGWIHSMPAPTPPSILWVYPAVELFLPVLSDNNDNFSSLQFSWYQYHGAWQKEIMQIRLKSKEWKHLKIKKKHLKYRQ